MFDVITKTMGKLELKLISELGGAISSLKYEGIDILRPLPRLHDVAVNESGCFPLIPYSNRISEGKFKFEGEEYKLIKNFGEHPHSIHGNAWKEKWELQEESNTKCTLEFIHSIEGDGCYHWPWPYKATQVFELSEKELQIKLEYFNCSDSSVPVGLGFHPYFANANKSKIQFTAEKVLINDSNSLPCSIEKIPEKWNYSTLCKPEANSVDNCFVGWGGEAQVIWPESKIKIDIKSPESKNIVVFIPSEEKNFVAIEPVTNVNNAINDLVNGECEQSMMLVEPGKSVFITMIIKVSKYE